MSSFALRIPEHVLKQAKTAAKEEEISINQLFPSYIAEGLGQRNGLRMMRKRAAHADLAKAFAVLDKVPTDTEDAVEN